MGFFCPVPNCLNHSVNFSRRELREFGSYCTAACCGALLLKREVASLAAPADSPSVGPTKITTTVVNKVPSTRTTTPGILLRKQDCAIVVSVASNPPLELVYPSLVKKKDTEVPETPSPQTDRLTGNLLPPWARPARAAAPVVRQSCDWPAGAFGYNGINYFDANGKVLLSPEAAALQKAVRRSMARKAKVAAIERYQQRKRLRTASQRRAAARFQRVHQLCTLLRSQVALLEARQVVLSAEKGPELSEAQEALVQRDVARSQATCAFWEQFVRKMKAHKATIKKAAAEARHLAEEKERAQQWAPLDTSTSTEIEEVPIVGYVRALPAFRLARDLHQVVHGHVTFDEEVRAQLNQLCVRFYSVTRCDWRMVATEKYNAILQTLIQLTAYVPDGQYYAGLKGLTQLTPDELKILNEDMGKELVTFQELGQTAQAHGFVDFVRSTAKRLGEHLTSTVQDLYVALATKCQDAVAKTIDFIFNEVKQQFMKCMSPYLQPIQNAKEIIENFWRKCRGWVTNLWNSAPLQILLLGIATIWVTFIVTISAMVYLLEKLLVGLGILNTTGVVLGSFLTLTSIYLGLNAFGGNEGFQLFNNAWKNAIRLSMGMEGYTESWQHMARHLVQTADAHSGMTTAGQFLTQIGASLASGTGTTLKSLGKWGQTMDQIRKGKDCTRDLLAFITEQCGDAYAMVTGSDAEIFQEIQSLVRIDMQRWVKDSQQVLRHAVSTSPNDAITFALVERLSYDGDILLRNLDNSGKRISPGMSRCVGLLHKELKEVYKSLSASGQFDERMQPFWVYLYGESHCGKTLASSTIVQELLNEIGAPPTSVACKTQTDKYFSRYHRERAVLIDDISSTTMLGGQNLEPEMIQMVSTAEYSIAKADCAEKGMLFDSEIIVSTSNFFDAPTQAGINCKSAYQNRRAVVLQCRMSPLLEFDPTFPQGAIEARFVDRCTETPIHVDYLIKPKQREVDVAAKGELVEEWAPLMEKLEEIKRYMAHFRYQEQTLMDYRRRIKQRACPMYEDGAKFILHNIKAISELNVYAVPTADEAMLMAIDGKAYSVSISGHAREYDIPSADVTQLELRTLNKTCDYVTAQLPEGMRRGMVGCFLDGMCAGKNHVDSVEKMSNYSSSAYKEFFSSLALAERIYLRAVQKRIDGIENHPCGFFQPDWKLKLAMKLKNSFEEVWNGKGRILLLLLALALMVTVFWKFFATLRAFCQGAGMAGFFAAFQALDAHSVIASSTAGDSYIARSSGSSYRQTTARAHSSGDDIMNADFCTDMLVRIDVVGRAIVSALRGRNRSLILTNHQAIAIPDRSRVYITYTVSGRGGQSFAHEWRHSNIIAHEGSEAVIYSSPQLSPLPAGAENRYLSDPMALPRNFEIHGCVIKLRKNFITTLDGEDAGVDGDTPLLAHWKSAGTIAHEKQTIVSTVNGAPYMREIPMYIRSNCPANVEDCGAILSVMHCGLRKIIGIHVAGRRVKQGGSWLYLSTGSFLPAYDVMPAHSNLPSCLIPELGLQSEGIDKIGYVPNRSVVPHIATKTQLTLVPDTYRYPGKIEKEPAILSKEDPRIPLSHAGYNPLVDGVRKFENPMQPLDAHKLSEVAASIVTEWFDCRTDLKDVTLDVVINGEEGEAFLDAMVMGTSEGYPYVCERKAGEKGKHRYFQPRMDDPLKLEMRPGTSVSRDFDRLLIVSQETVPEMECMEIPKDERLVLRKIYDKPGTRLFSCLPLPYNMALRQKYLAFAQMLQGSRHRLPCQVGINPASREWQEIYTRLAEKSDRAINCDYSKFDGLMTYQILDTIADMINKCYSDSAVSKIARKNLLLGICNRKSIAGSQVYEVRAGIPSGCALTVLLNSIFNEILIKYVYMSVVPDPERCYFNRHVCLLTYGDDNLIAIGNDVIDRFNGKVIKETLATYGVTITDGTNKLASTLESKPLLELDFLKRGFRILSTGQILAPLEKTAIYASLQYVNAGGGDTLGPLRLNVENSLRELWAHQDEGEFLKVRNHFIEKCGYNDLPTWAYFSAWYNVALSGKTAYMPHRQFEVQPANVGARAILHSQARQDAITGLGNRIAVACHAYKPLPNDFIVSIGELLRHDESGVCVPATLAYGTGGAVNRKFQSHVRSNVYLQEAHAAGRNIVFRDRQPCINAWVAAITFTTVVGGTEREALRFYREHRPRGLSDLAEYFEKNNRFISRCSNPFIPSVKNGDKW